eukprot:4204921-Pyramimonas_sp.AAC.1
MCRVVLCVPHLRISATLGLEWVARGGPAIPAPLPSSAPPPPSPAMLPSLFPSVGSSSARPCPGTRAGAASCPPGVGSSGRVLLLLGGGL